MQGLRKVAGEGVVRGEGYRGSVLKDRVFSYRSTFFSLRVDPFLKGLCC